MRPEIPVDFHDCDPQGRVRLNSIDTLEQLGITLEEGLRVLIYSEDIELEGVVQYSEEEGIWVCRILIEDYRVWNGAAWESVLVDLLLRYYP